MPRTRPPALVFIRLVLAGLVFMSTTGCPPALWTGDGYVVDSSGSSQAKPIVGRCYRLLVDVETRYTDEHIALRGDGTIDVYGRGDVIAPKVFHPGPFNLPKGSTIVVERVLTTKTVEMSWRTPYIRVNGKLMNAEALFRDTGAGEGPFRLTYVDRFLEPCDAAKGAVPDR
jgi:hypothetical protein